MSRFKYSLSLFAIIIALFFTANLVAAPGFTYSVNPIPFETKKLMQQYTWRPGCPVSLEDLAYLKLSYWGFDNKTHIGTLIVNKKLATETVAIFRDLFTQRFPIERMDVMDVFKGDDDAAMAANNTSAFNCRAITGQPGTFSLHSYGVAIDVNTRINPYVKDDLVLPPAGKAYLDRSNPEPGLIQKDDSTYNAFVKRGWTWGGSWETRQDYQHFEKPV